MKVNLDGKECDHVGSILSSNYQCFDCGHYLTKQEFILKVSRQIVICEEEIKRE